MKKHLLGAAALTTSLLAAGSARAESEWVKVFDVDGPARTGSAEVALVNKYCNFHMMSRMGPDPKEVAACEASMTRLSARGAAAAPAIMAALDREETPYTARDRLYAALARTEDAAVAGKVIDAMAKVATGSVEQRTYEASQMEEVAEAILHGAPQQRAPWVQQPTRDPQASLTDRVVAWRAYQRDNAGKAPAQLAVERLAEARAQAAGPDLEKAFLAVRYLMSRDPAAAKGAAETLLARLPDPAAGQKDELAPVRRQVQTLYHSAEYQARQAEDAARARAAKAAPRTKSAPSQKAKPPVALDSKSRS